MLHQFLILLLIALWYLLIVQINLSNPPASPPSRFPQIVWWLLMIVDLLLLAWVMTGMPSPSISIKGG